MATDEILQVRSFNRAVTQRAGALDDSFLGRGRPLGEARLLYEIGEAGAESRALRARLSLDSGYLSRLLASLETHGLVRTRAAAEDRRVRHVSLTRKGLAEVRHYDKRSDAFAQSLLAPLSETQRSRLLAAMAEVERLMRASAIVVETVPAGSRDALWCLQQYYSELRQRFEAGFDAATSLSPSAEALTPPQGCFLVTYLDGAPVGCGAVKVVGDMGEIKRLWVSADVRGLGLGRRLLQALEEHAKRAGGRVLRLDTNRTLTEAQALYRASGYREIERYNDEPYAHHWFEKRLG